VLALYNELCRNPSTQLAPVSDRRYWPSIAAYYTVFYYFRLAVRQHRTAVGVSLSQIHGEISGWSKSFVKSYESLGMFSIAVERRP
jgi:hypothetical protein